MSSLNTEQTEAIRRFVEHADISRGCLELDLDNTAVHEDRGRIYISEPVEHAVKKIHDLGLPVVINTLRFPLSVIRTIGDDWYQIAETPIPTVLLNGSVLGYVKRENEMLVYEEIQSFPMMSSEIDHVVQGIAELLGNGVQNIILFFYSSKWTLGETIWTPDPEKVAYLRQKYTSASRVITGDVERLREGLRELPICMVSLRIDHPKDKLMAYQHSEPHSFFTHRGVNKASGMRCLAESFKLSLEDSFGAGDSEMDTFLADLGMAIHVVGEGSNPPSYKGKRITVQVTNSFHLGEFLNAVGDEIKNKH